MDNMKEKWNEIKEKVKREYDLSDISYRTWIEGLQIHSVEGDVVNIMIPSDQANALDYISKKFTNIFIVTISEMFDHDYEVNFLLESKANSLGSASSYDKKPDTSSMENMNHENANLIPRCRFETFVVGSNNKFAHASALAVAESFPMITYNPLFLYGGPGLGKTHLMHSIGHMILDNHPNMKVLYVTSEEFTNEVIESIRSGNAASMTKLREKYRTVDVLMIDDVQNIIGKISTQEEFFNTFNALHSTGKQIILSSDKPPKQMTALDERFRSRFEWGLTADIQPPDYETKVAILRKYAETTFNINIPEEINQYIANNIKSSIRDLEGAVKKIVFLAKLNHVDTANITMDLAEEALRDKIDPNNEVTPKLIIEVVAEHFGIKPEDITSQRRNAEFAFPRQIVMYLCRKLTDTSYTNIAKLLNKKDHTTIIHGCDKIEESLSTDKELQNKIQIIEKKIIPS
ncbi:MAG: chromosomal replication initiator protein DnaA [Lachnospiraceae bacterium]|nr:chromosomal replication initiator protein DnaA [Lachnospiraceae bacterium]MBR3470735.1 chromosomal replication initiator protein DnaA [Lachnospiraceae bacterium]